MVLELEGILRTFETRGYRVTPARRDVVAATIRQGGHFTADDVARQVHWAGRATVFRTIKLLQEMGILCRVLLEDGALHYRLSEHSRHHHHLLCISCGNVQDLDDCVAVDLVSELAQRMDYDIEGHWLELYGRCPSCRSAAVADKAAI